MTKNYEDLTFREDYMFCITQPAHPEITKRLAELATGRKQTSVFSVRNQMPIRLKRSGRGVRFDVQYEDREKVIDFEMQNRKRKAFEKRIRYYQSMLDGNMLRKKEDYAKLKDAWIVFICLYDPFGKGLLKYTFQGTCKEDPSLHLNTGANVVVLNADQKVLLEHGDDGSELYRFLCYIAGIKNVPMTELTEMIQEAVDNEIADEEGRKRYMSLKEMLDDERHEGMSIGFNKGKVQGKAEGKAEGLMLGKAEGRDALTQYLVSTGMSLRDAKAKAEEIIPLKQ